MEVSNFYHTHMIVFNFDINTFFNEYAPIFCTLLIFHYSFICGSMLRKIKNVYCISTQVVDPSAYNIRQKIKNSKEEKNPPFPYCLFSHKTIIYNEISITLFRLFIVVYINEILSFIKKIPDMFTS